MDVFNSKVRIKIGIDLTFASGQPTGVERYVFNLLNSLIDLRPTWSYRVFCYPGQESLIRDRLKMRSNLHFYKIRYPVRLFELAKRFRVPLVNRSFPNMDIAIFPAFQLLPIRATRKIVFIYDLSFERFPEYGDVSTVKGLRQRVINSAKNADHVVTISEFSKAEIIDQYKIRPDKISVIYPAVDGQAITPTSEENRELVLNKYDLRSNYLLFVGTIEPRKNIIGLINAFEIIASKKPHMFLVLVGKNGWKSEAISIRIKGSKYYDRIKILNYLEDRDLSALYAGANALIFPSFYEGFGIPVLEAMSLGVPVVTSNKGSLKELAKKGALLVNELNAKEIAAASEMISNDKSLAIKLSMEGLQESKKYSWITSSKLLAELLDSTLVSNK